MWFQNLDSGGSKLFRLGHKLMKLGKSFIAQEREVSTKKTLSLCCPNINVYVVIRELRGAY